MMAHLGQVLETLLLVALSVMCAVAGRQGIRGGPVVLPFFGPSPNQPVNARPDSIERDTLRGDAAQTAGVAFVIVAIACLVGAIAVWT